MRAAIKLPLLAVLLLQGVAAVAAPSIILPPVGAVLNLGQNATLQVSATNNGSGGALNYQWMKDGGILKGQTNSSLNFVSFQFTNSGSYQVVVNNGAGLTISLPASLSLPSVPMLGWGYNASGQLGNGTFSNINRPFGLASNVVAAAAGLYCSMFITSDGTLWTMGDNRYGQLGNGTTLNTNRPISIASNVVAVAAGSYHSLFVKRDGTLWAMGYNRNGQLGNSTTNNSSVPVSVVSNVVAVVAGHVHSLFVKSDGTLWAMGNNSYGQLGNGTIIDTNQPINVASNVVGVAAGSHHSLFLKSDGSLWAMGYNIAGELGTGATTANYPYGVIIPTAVASNVVAVAAGGSHSLFVKNNGTLWATGWNTYGQLGNGTTNNSSVPITVASNVVAVAAGWLHSLLVKSDGSLWAMGWNAYGQLGNGMTIDTNLPVQIIGIQVASLCSMNTAYHSLVLGCVPLLFTQQPSNQLVLQGSNAFFTITANGGPPLVYQWYFITSNTLSFTAGGYAQTLNGFVYDVVVTNGGAGYSAPPQVNFSGGGGFGAAATATLTNGVVSGISVINTGSGYSSPPAVQIDSPNGILPGATNAFLNILAVTTNNVGDYYCVIANVYSSSITSSVATLSLAYPPGINQQPQNQAAALFGSTQFAVNATGYPPPGYQWFMVSGIQSNATATPVVINGFVLGANVTSGGAGYLAPPNLQFVGGSGSGASGYAVVSNRMVSSITINNTGSGYTVPPVIQIDAPKAISLPNQTSSILYLSGITSNNAANYFVVVSNNWGSITSSPATLSLLPFMVPQNFTLSTTNAGRMNLQLSGTPNYPYILQAATNLTAPVNWLPIRTNPANGDGSWQFTDTNLNGGQKFYRAIGQ